MATGPARKRRVATAGAGLLAALLAGPAVLADTRQPDPQRELDRVQQDLKAGEAQRRQLDSAAEALEAELADLRARAVQAATEQRRQEDALAHAEAALDAVARDEAERSRRIDADREAMAELLGALQRLSRLPPEAMVARPERPADTVRSALLLRALVPELKTRADGLAADLEKLAEVRTDLAARRDAAATAAATLGRQQREMAVLVARREELSRSTAAERKALDTKLASLASKAGDLKDLVERLEAERKEAERKAAAEAARRAAAEAEREKRARDSVAALGRATGVPRLTGMIMPVAGEVTTRYGQADAFGGTSRGLTFKGRSGAVVVAPYDGSVLFAGPFKGYGLILIVEHANGYHSLLAGLGRIDSQVGQRVLTGEPVGAMATDGSQSLYFELRRGGQPINPLRGFAPSDGKGQG